MNCRYCGKPAPSENLFCEYCGKPLTAEAAPPQLVSCPHCGRETATDQAYCLNCGLPIVPTPSIEELLETAYTCLADGKWGEAIEHSESALRIQPHNASALLCVLLADFRVRRRSNLKKQTEPLQNHKYYQELLEHGDDDLVAFLEECNADVAERKSNARLEIQYQSACTAMQNACSTKDYILCQKQFMELGDYRDSALRADECFRRREDIRYDVACLMKDSHSIVTLKKAIEQFEQLKNYKDSTAFIEDCKESIQKIRKKRRGTIAKVLIVSVVLFVVLLVYNHTYSASSYNKASILFTQRKYYEAALLFKNSIGYADSLNHLNQCSQKLLESKEYKQAARIASLAGDLVSAWNIEYSYLGTSQIATGPYHTVAVKSDGTVVACGSNSVGQCNIKDWHNIVAVAVGPSHTVGLKVDGTVVACGDNALGQCEVTHWNNVVAVFAGKTSSGQGYTLGLKSDGTVLHAGDTDRDSLNAISSWKNIITIVIPPFDGYPIGINKDSAVFSSHRTFPAPALNALDYTIYMESNSKLLGGLNATSDIVCLPIHTENRKWHIGGSSHYLCNWDDVISIHGSARFRFLIGITSNGSLEIWSDDHLSVEANAALYALKQWQDIRTLSTYGGTIMGLKKDGTVVAFTENSYADNGVAQWEEIGSKLTLSFPSKTF